MTAFEATESESPIKVMQVVPALNVGGVERGTVEFAQYLKQQGHQSIVVSAGGTMVKTLEQAGVQHITLNVNKKSLSSLFSVNKLRHLMNEHDVDVVHARSRIPAWLSYFALKKLPSKRPHFVTTLHGLHSVSKYSAIMASGDQVIAVSDAAKEYLQSNFSDYLKHEPVVIPRGIDEQFSYGHKPNKEWLTAFNKQFPQLLNSKKVLLPGRLTRVKGVENLLHWLKNSDVSHQLLLTASPDESKYSRKIHQMLEHNGVSERVVWLGLQTDMPNLYAAVDVVVSSNNKPESFGRTVLEAISVGTPVVGFASGGVKEVLKNTFPEGIVEDQNTEQLASVIDQFLVNRPSVKPHNLYSNQNMFEKTLAVYRGVMDAN